MTALAFTAGALFLSLGAYYGTGAVRRYLRGREDARYRIRLAIERRRAEGRAERAAAELDKPREGMPPRPSMAAPRRYAYAVDPAFDPCGAPPVGRRP